MKGAKLLLGLSITILLITLLFSMVSPAAAEDNAATYVYLELAETDQDISPSGTAQFDITVRNLGDDDITYNPPSPTSFGLPTGWSVTFNPASNIFIPGDQYSTLEVLLTAPSDAKANLVIDLEIEGTTSSPTAEIIPVDISATVIQNYGIELSAEDKIVLASPVEPRNLEIAITNTGNGDDRVAIELTNVPTGLSLSQEAEEFIIGPGSTDYFTFTMFPSSILTAGEYELNISLYRVKEGSLERLWVSSHTLIVDVLYYPDLAVSTGDIELSRYAPANGEDIQINVTVHNKGDSDARNVTVRVYPVTRSGSKLEDIDERNIAFLGMGDSTTLHIPWTATPPAVNKLLVQVDPDDAIGELDDENNNAELHFFINPQPTNPPVEGSSGEGYTLTELTGYFAIGVLATATISVFASILSTEYGKFALSKLLIPFYTRVKKEEVLNHEVRELVYDYVKTHPGEHYRAILTKLGLTNGTLVHHLHTLERQEFIKSERDGPFKRFYPTGRQLTEDVLEINGIQKKILEAVKGSPGLTQKDLARVLQTSPPTINYHVKALLSVRLLNLKRDGKNTRCYPGSSMNGWFRRGGVA